MKTNHSQCILSFVAMALMAWPALAQPVAAPDADPASAALPPLGDTLPALTLPVAPIALPAASTPATTNAPTGAALPALPTTPANAANTGGASQSAVSALSNAINNATGTGVTTPEPAAPKSYSYGDSNLSIMFLPEQVEKMKEAIRTFEDSGASAQAPAPVVGEVAAVAAPEPPIEDPLTMPIFYLSSIAYDAPGDWSVWISGYKITSRKNDTDVNVLSVTPDSVTFQWMPSFTKALVRRQRDKLFAPTDPVKNKLAALQRYSIDESTGAVTFTLKQNQTFAVGYFRVFEGYIDSPSLSALPVVVPVAANPPGTTSPSQPPEQLLPFNNGQPDDPGFTGSPSENFNGVPALQAIPPN